MTRNVFLALICLLFNVAQATETVRLRTDIDFAVTGSVGSTISLNVENTTGDETTESLASKIYFPIENSSTNSHNFYITTTSSLFDVSNSAHVALIPLTINTPADAVQRYLYAAVKDPTNSNNYKVIKKYTSAVLPIGSQTDVSFSFAPADICLSIASECTNLLAASSTETEKSFVVYFFLSTQSSYGASDTISPATLNSGIYLTMLMSNRTYDSSKMIITISNTRVGDNRLTLDYSANATLSATYAKNVRIFKHTSAPGSVNSPISTYASNGALTTQEYPYAQSGELIVKDLENNTPVFLSVVFVDKFNMVTNLSDDITGTPLDIQELLKKQGCFLLTAGFGEEHYVINYFKHFRDTILAHSKLGRMFIHFYYENAPKYALQIYQSDALRFSIRALAYVTYFVFNFAWVLVGLFIFVFWKNFQKNIKKIKQIFSF